MTSTNLAHFIKLPLNAAYGIELTFSADTKHMRGSPFDVENNTNLMVRFHGAVKERTDVYLESSALRSRITRLNHVASDGSKNWSAGALGFDI